ncbi:hypothetical protein G6F22_017741 [Rhizopus arrhizus]|nr:hypothetical protein G6F22_017741 [Rhizopus arrhizus]
MPSQQEAHAFALVQVAHDLENLFHDLRGQAHGRFVQQDHVGVGHQRAADGGHLLFAARRIAGLARAALLQAREVLVDAFQRGRGIAAAHAAGVGAGQQVLFDGQVGKAMPAFHHLHDAALDEFGRRQPFEMARKVVVLPAPLAPSNATILPSGTCRDTPLSTRITWL